MGWVYAGHIVLFATATIGCGFAAYWALQNQTKRAATAFGGFALIVALWNSTALLQLLVSHGGLLTVLYILTRVWIVLMVVFWAAFGFRYAGYDVFTRSRLTMVGGGFGTGILLALVAAPPMYPLTYTEFAVYRGVTPVVYHPGTTVITEAIRATGAALFILGSAVILYRLVDVDYANNWQVIAVLSVTIVVVVIEVFAPPLLLPIEAIDYTALTAALVVGTYVGALYRYDIFGHRPIGKRDLLDNLDDPLVAINPDGYVVVTNEAARDVLSLSDPVGREAASVLPAEVSHVADGCTEQTTVELVTEDTTSYYDVRVRSLREVSGDRGRAVIFRDVTEIHQQTQQLEARTAELDLLKQLIMRVLRHNVRTELTVIRGQGNAIAAETDEPYADRAEIIVEAADNIERVTKNARTIAKILNAGTEPVTYDLSKLAAGAIDQVKQDHPSVTFSFEHPDTAEAVAIRGLQTAIYNLIQNAVVHNTRADPEVSITIEQTATETTICIVDNGSGIPEEELVAIERGTETDLEHGSGAGLWVVEMVVRQTDGEIEFETGPDGTAVCLTLPRESPE